MSWSTTEDEDSASRSTDEGEDMSTTEDVGSASRSTDGGEDCGPERACIHPTPLMFCMSTSYSLSVQDMTQSLQLQVRTVPPALLSHTASCKVAKSVKSKVQNEPRNTLRQGLRPDTLLHSRW